VRGLRAGKVDDGSDGALVLTESIRFFAAAFVV
jgi:hypothetical protein